MVENILWCSCNHSRVFAPMSKLFFTESLLLVFGGLILGSNDSVFLPYANEVLLRIEDPTRQRMVLLACATSLGALSMSTHLFSPVSLLFFIFSNLSYCSWLWGDCSLRLSAPDFPVCLIVLFSWMRGFCHPGSFLPSRYCTNDKGSSIGPPLSFCSSFRSRPAELAPAFSVCTSLF
ncbi:predicted protein [Clavispora lusitaniae ATCC 42720]|uniref:Uncharacterized protein n=1 Tax=Clavispora lusitaniae (strain ATCC 42720) TaxID=306902 RepID=C4Y219_CLAL4|nr:uncharacterized protein CLUG_02251 [Clavispora lusitaniae ATCC 42720]EEQ38128.1 predicted protein [Clavispora lusitaniae ATCC 42720]